ncbi:PREDICTED: mucin-like protein [Amphimedon queenslandica]|uniref:VWFD domain-containing protein n=2 Tax=Amphimedon queenslandica TaxID=400682 RepID=A0AAN0II18_AMPQE|nr:PREDICTED: mucin-like protein [Amphimedon queenslandica]|eukprot:XP_003389333.1 PREDICTED: mucin-like protein [Amphimedon queenslandica]
MKINCKTSLSLFIAILWLLLPAPINGSMIGEGPYTTYATLGSTAGVSSKCLERKLRSSSHTIRIPTGFPIGSSVQHKAYVSANGVISFEKPIKCGDASPFPTNLTNVENGFIVAPYWSDSDIRSTGSVCYEVHDDINSSPLMRTVSDIVHKLTGTSYNGYWLMVAQWRNVHPFPHGASFLGQLNSDIQSFANKVNSYQAIIITDHVRSYALFTYRCNDLQWYGYMKNAIIGTNTGGGSQYNNYNVSNFKEIVCINMPDSEFYSIVYQLSSPGFSSSNQTKYQECSNYYYEDIAKYGSNDVLASQAQGLPPCPCSGQQAQLDGMWREIKTGLNCYNYKFPSSTNATQRCCYSTDSTGWGALKTAQSTDQYGTNMIVYHENAANVTDTGSDEYFRSICCSNGVGLCSLYYARRPPNDCTGYTPSSWGWGYGDPHMMTFDGTNYTFNNLGEFYLLKLRDRSLIIQGRTSLVTDTGLSSVANANATQFTSIAFRNGAHTIEFNATSGGIRTYYNQGRNITSALYNVGSFLYPDKTFVISRETTDTLLIAFACDIWASLSITSGVLHFRVSVPTKYKSNTFSLLGYYNGNPNVDLVRKNGRIVNPTHDNNVYYFAEDWRVESDSDSYFIDPNPTPIQNFVPVMVSNAISSAGQEALVQCGYDTACTYDAVLTGSISLGLTSLRVHSLNIADLAKLTNFPPNITGDPVASFVAASGAKLSYNFSVTDTGSFTVVLANITNSDHVGQLNKLSTGSVNGTTVEKWEYSFEWGPSNTTNFSVTFIATDSSHAASILEVKVQLCYCLNGGSCSDEHIKDLTSSTILLPCDCSTDVWDGEYCQSDANGCDDCSCYDGVSCTDNVSPLSGVTCGACPAGLFKGDERCIDNSTSNNDDDDDNNNNNNNTNNNNNNNNGNSIDSSSSNVTYMCSSRLDKVNKLSLINGSTQYSCTGGYKLMVSSMTSNATTCESSVYDCTGGSCINVFTDADCNCPSGSIVTNGICAAKDDCFLSSLTPTIDCNNNICPLYDGGYQCSSISNSFASCTSTNTVSSSTTTASYAITTSNVPPTTTTIPDPGKSHPNMLILLLLILIVLVAIVICIVLFLLIIVCRSNRGPNRIMIGLHRRVHVQPAGFGVNGRELQVIQNPHAKRGLISMGILEGAKAMTAVATVATVSNALEVVSLDGSDPEDW